MKKMFTLGHKYFRSVALMVPNFVCFLHNLFRHWGLGSEGPCSASEGHNDTMEKEKEQRNKKRFRWMYRFSFNLSSSFDFSSHG